MDADTVPTYAQQAIDRWTLQGRLTTIPGLNSLALHDPRACGCLVCADGREALGMSQPMPAWSRKSVPDFYRGRWRK